MLIATSEENNNNDTNTSNELKTAAGQTEGEYPVVGEVPVRLRGVGIVIVSLYNASLVGHELRVLPLRELVPPPAKREGSGAGQERQMHDGQAD